MHRRGKSAGAKWFGMSNDAEGPPLRPGRPGGLHSFGEGLASWSDAQRAPENSRVSADLNRVALPALPLPAGTVATITDSQLCTSLVYQVS